MFGTKSIDYELYKHNNISQLRKVTWRRTNFSKHVSEISVPHLELFRSRNSDPKTPKSVDFWCKLSSPFDVAEPRERCFELFRMQNSQKSFKTSPLDAIGEGLQRPPDSPAAQRFFSSLRSSKIRHPQKVAGYGTEFVSDFRYVA